MEDAKKILILNLIINIFLAIIKILAGLLGQSSLLFADGIHSLSDLITDVFSMLGLKAAERKKDEEHPFGHGNLEYAFNLIVSILIAFMAYELTLDLIQNWSATNKNVNHLVIFVAITTFVIKFAVSIYILKKADQLDSSTLKASGRESKADAYSSIIAIIGLVLTDIGVDKDMYWLTHAENIATMFIIGMLFKTAWEILRDAFVGIAGAKANDNIVAMYKDKITVIDSSIGEIADVIVLRNGIHYSVFAKIKFNENTDLKMAEATIKNIKSILHSDANVNKVAIDFYLD